MCFWTIMEVRSDQALNIQEVIGIFMGLVDNKNI